MTPRRLDRTLQLRERIRLARAGCDAGVREPSVRREALEEVHSGLEEGDGLGALRTARRQTGRLESAVAGAVCRPLVLPELFG